MYICFFVNFFFNIAAFGLKILLILFHSSGYSLCKIYLQKKFNILLETFEEKQFGFNIIHGIDIFVYYYYTTRLLWRQTFRRRPSTVYLFINFILIMYT